MEKKIEKIFGQVFDMNGIMAEINSNLRPVLLTRKDEENRIKYIEKLSFCVGYQIKKNEVLKTIIYNYMLHHTIGKDLNRKEILEKVDGIISAEVDVKKLMELTEHYFSSAAFKSDDERDATYIMTCMKHIIESWLAVSFIEYISIGKSDLLVKISADKGMTAFNRTIEKYTKNVLDNISKATAV
jgi:hypothetical protein